MRMWLRVLVDYGALVAFAVAYLIFRLNHNPDALIAATPTLMIGSVVAVALGYLVERRLAPNPAIYGAFALVFGGLTLIFHDDRFLRMKPTFAYAAFAIGLTTTRAEFLPRVDDTTYMSPKPSRSICLSMLCQFVASPTKKRVSFASNRWRNSASVIGVMQVRVMELPIFLEILRNASANRLAPNAPPMVVMKLSQNRNN